MGLPVALNPARLLTRNPITCPRAIRSRTHYQASSSHSAGSDVAKTHHKKSQSRGGSVGKALSSLTIQPLQRSSKGTGPSWSSGIVCTGENCSYKADPRTVAWLKDLFDGLDTDRFDWLQSCPATDSALSTKAIL